MVDRTSPMEHIGRQFGNYRLLKPLGIRANASIYLGEHIHLKTRAAIKLYQLRLLQDDQQQFLAEARIIARLVHPHIARVLEFGTEQDIPYMVTAYVAEATLREHYPAGTVLPLPTVLSYVKQIAVALDYIHSQQVLHLDVRPESMWLERNNNKLLLSDFRPTLSSRSSRSAQLQDITAAVAYMAPEQLQGRPCPESDQYALGIAVYEWLCGSLPFIGADYVEIAQQHLQAPPPSLVSRVPDLPSTVERVVMKALMKDATQRFPSVQAFADALERSCLAPNNTSWKISAGASKHATSAEFDYASNGSRNTGKHPSRRTVALGLVGLTGALAIGGSGTYWYLHRPPSSPQISIKPVPRGTTFHIYGGHVDNVYGVAWSRDGARLASWSYDDTMQIWSSANGSRISTYPMANVLSWSPDWRFIASGTTDYFEVWELANGRIRKQHVPPRVEGLVVECPVNTLVQWSPDGKYVASTTYEGLAVWNAKEWKMIFSRDYGSTAWSSDGKRIALWDYNPLSNTKLQIIDVENEKQIRQYDFPRSNSIVSFAWSPDGKYLASGDGKIWDALSGKYLAAYNRQPEQIRSLVWSPNSKYLAVFDNMQATAEYASRIDPPVPKIDTTVRIWNVHTAQDEFVYAGHTAGVNHVAWSQDGTKIASASADMTVRVWQAV